MISSVSSTAVGLSAMATQNNDTARQVQLLRETDRKVRAHEQAHMAAGAGLVRGNSFSFQTGPDQKRYAVAGEVSIDTSPGNTPQETLRKAEQIRAAALAPADPSPQDNRVAAEASQMASNARQALAQAQQASASGSSDTVLASETRSSTSSALALYRQVAAAPSTPAWSVQA